MCIRDSASAIAQQADVSAKDAAAVLSAMGDVICETVGKGEKVSLPGLMTIERVERSARTGRNPRTGESMEIPASFGAKLSAGSALKAAAKG